MKKALFTIIFLTCTIVSVLIYQKQSTPESNNNTKPSIKIGVLLPLTGNFAELGKNVRETMKLAIEDSNPKNINIELIFEDDAFNPSKTATLANKLITIDKVDAIVSWSAVGGNVVSTIADSNKIIHFGITNDPNVAKGDYNFIHFTSSVNYVKKLFTLLEKHNVKKLAMIIAYQPGLQRTADIEEKMLQEKGIETKRYNITNETRDFNMLIESLMSQDFDMWDISANPPAVDIIVKTALTKGVKVPLTSLTAFSYANDKSIFEGLEYIESPDGDANLLDRLKTITGSENFFSVGYSYDVIKILAQTYDTNYPNTDADTIANSILSLTDYNGAVGTVEIDKNGIIHSNAVIKKIINSKPVTIEE